MKNRSAFQLNMSMSAAAKAAAFSFLLSCGFAFAQPKVQAPAPVTERSTGGTVNAPAVTTPATKPAASANVENTKVAATTVAPTVTPAVTPTAAPAPKTYVTIGDKPATLFDAPSNRANKTFIVLRNTPLELLVKLDKWIKVRDMEGTIGWVENDAISARRHVLVNVATADVRAAADAASALVFDAQRQVVLEVTGPATNGWLAVKHRDGQTGFVRLTHIWGD